MWFCYAIRGRDRKDAPLSKLDHDEGSSSQTVGERGPIRKLNHQTVRRAWFWKVGFSAHHCLRQLWGLRDPHAGRALSRIFCSNSTHTSLSPNTK
jgi:hypothetical protein